MDAPGQESLARFHRALVEEIARTRPLYLKEPFTVSEIYQNLVPYQTHRDRIGVEMNGDYEDVLLRLLAGEGDYLVLESDHARREMSDELRSPSPNTGLYREYAAADVRLNPLRIPGDFTAGGPGNAGAAATAPPSGEAFEARSPAQEGEAAAQGNQTPAARPDREAAPQPEPVDVGAPGGAPGPAAPCPWCREPLPHRDNLNYCPFCGADMHKLPCSNCGEELDMGWRFCVACGTAVGDAD